MTTYGRYMHLFGEYEALERPCLTCASSGTLQQPASPSVSAPLKLHVGIMKKDDSREPEVDQLSQFLSVMNAENERGLPISAGAMLDEVLGEILRAFMAEMLRKHDYLMDLMHRSGLLPHVYRLAMRSRLSEKMSSKNWRLSERSGINLRMVGSRDRSRIIQ